MHASSRSLLLSDSEYDIHCSLFLHNMSLKRAFKYTPYEKQMNVRQFQFLQCSGSLFCMTLQLMSHLISRHLFHSRVNLTVLFLCSSISASN